MPNGGSNSRMVPQYDVIGTAEYYETQYKTLANSRSIPVPLRPKLIIMQIKLCWTQKWWIGIPCFIPCLMVKKLIGNNFKLNPNAKLGILMVNIIILLTIGMTKYSVQISVRNTMLISQAVLTN